MGLALKMCKADVPDKLNQGFLLDHELKTGTHSLIIAKALKIFFFGGREYAPSFSSFWHPDLYT